MEAIVIQWEILSQYPKKISYLIDGVNVGEDDEGLDKILAEIKDKSYITKVIIKMREVASLGGESLENTLPFAKRYIEFKAALGNKKLLFEMF